MDGNRRGGSMRMDERMDKNNYVEWVVRNGQGGGIRIGEVDGWDRRGGWMGIGGVGR